MVSNEKLKKSLVTLQRTVLLKNKKESDCVDVEEIHTYFEKNALTV